MRLNHAVVGLAGEVGELAGAVEKWVYYGQELDRVNVAEELGDLLWYVALACNALGLDLGAVMRGNIAKLQARYPDKYSGDRAVESGRDRGAERAVLEQDGHGFGHAPGSDMATGEYGAECDPKRFGE